jgi:hypothetical protein
MNTGVAQESTHSTVPSCSKEATSLSTTYMLIGLSGYSRAMLAAAWPLLPGRYPAW